jgi:streptogramin lyase
MRINVLLTLVILSSMAARSSAQSKVSIRVYPTDQAGRITAGPDGALWFTETVAGKIGRITTAGVLTEYAIPAANSYPYGITTGPDGALWFTEVNAQKIGRITTDGLVTEYPVSGTPTTSFLRDITAGADGALWFNKWCTGISRITTAGAITDYSTSSCPQGITAGPDGAVWFADFYQVGRITPEGVMTSFPVPNYVLQSIAVGSDSALWFTAYLSRGPQATSPTIGRITTAGSITKYPLRAEEGFAYLITAGPDGALWFMAAGTNENIGRILTDDGTSEIVPVGAPCQFAGNPFNGMVLGSDRALWLSCSDGNIVQITPHTTTTTLVSSVNPSKYGQKVTWAAMVTTTGTVAPTGNVVFQWSRDGQKHTIGTAPLNAAGVAALTRSNLNTDPFGQPYPIVASYSGDASNLSSKSAVLSQHVLQTKTVATLASSANPSTQGQAVTFTAKITSPTAVITGPVTFSVGSSILGTAQLSGGIAKFTTSALPVGSSTVKVTYSGDSNVAKSSASLVQTVR